MARTPFLALALTVSALLVAPAGATAPAVALPLPNGATLDVRTYSSTFPLWLVFAAEGAPAGDIERLCQAGEARGRTVVVVGPASRLLPAEAAALRRAFGVGRRETAAVLVQDGRAVSRLDVAALAPVAPAVIAVH